MVLGIDMAEDQDLFTDYALQLYSSFQTGDLQSIQYLLDSFKNDGKNLDAVFLPGLIYGLMFHFQSVINMLCDHVGITPKEFLERYALGYSLAREDLLKSPFFNVKAAKENLERMIALFEELESIETPEDFFNN